MRARVHPRVAMVTDHKANPSNAMWLGAGGFVRQPQPLIVPLCLPCQSHLTARAAETLSFSLDLSPSCFTSPHWALIGCPFRAAHHAWSEMGFMSCVCLIWGSRYLSLSRLHLRVYHISHLAAFTAVIHLAPANTQQYSPPSHSWSLTEFNLHGCLVPNTCHLLRTYLARHKFSSCFIWDFCPSSTICFVLFLSHFPKDLIPRVYGDGFAKCLLDSLCLCGFLWITKCLIRKANHAH